MEIREHLSVYLESGYLFDDMSGKLKWFEMGKSIYARKGKIYFDINGRGAFAY